MNVDPEFASNCIFNEIQGGSERWSSKLINWFKETTFFKEKFECQPIKGPDDKESWKL